jgi:hypothetical protein
MRPTSPPVSLLLAKSAVPMGVAALAFVFLIAGCGTPSAVTNSSTTTAPLAATTTTVIPTTTIPSDAQWYNQNQATVVDLINAYEAWHLSNVACSSESALECIIKGTTACSVLEGVTQAAEQLPPVPDPTVDRYWITALQDLGQGAQQCTDSGQTQDVSQLEGAIQELAAGRAALLQTGFVKPS